MTKRIMTPEAAEAHNMRIRANRIKQASKDAQSNTALVTLAHLDLSMTKTRDGKLKFIPDGECYYYSIPLSFPPSANTYWRHVNGRTILSAEARAYRKTVQAAVGVVKPLTGDLKVSLDYWYPDKRRRDIDNLIKQLFDALVIAGVMKDDCQVTDLHVRKIGYEKGGSVLVTIERILC